LTQEELKSVTKNLKQWSAEFDEGDRKLRDALSQRLDQSRGKALEEFMALYEKRLGKLMIVVSEL
jgi:flagellar biosynthesis chaperone FliJ